MRVEQCLKEAIQQAFQEIYEILVPLGSILLQPTHKAFQGTYTFVLFPFASQCKQKPDDIAQKLGLWIKNHAAILASYNVVKGFLNLSIAQHIWLEQLVMIGEDAHFGVSPSNKKKVIVEFLCPNTNKPLHLGHLRNSFLGSSLAEILRATGHQVHKVNLINDRGIHICKSMVAYQQFGKGETPENTGIKGDHLVGRYYVKFEQVYKLQVDQLTTQVGDAKKAAVEAPILKKVQYMLQQWEQGDPEVIALWKKMNQWVYQGFHLTYQQLNIAFDKIYYESDTYLLGKEIVSEGLVKNIFYKKEDGSVAVDLSKYGLGEKIVLRADGTSLYVTQDMGTIDLRYRDFKFDTHIYVVGNEQDYHFKVLLLLMKQLGRSYADGMYHLSYGMVDLPAGKMKSREGNVVDADHLIATMVDTVATYTTNSEKITNLSKTALQSLYHTLAMGALKFFLLRVSAQKRLLFNPEKSIDFQGDTGTFVQYTYARIASILRKVLSDHIVIDTMAWKNLDVLHPIEESLIIQLYQFPQKLQEAAEQYAPTTIANYVLELSKLYNQLYSLLPIIQAESFSLKQFRIYLSMCTSKVIKRSMQLLCVDLPERM